METGNPKQVAVLGVMAVAAVGFLLSRLGGKALPVVTVASAEHKTESAITASLGSSTLLVDPFSHPKLAPAKPKPSQTADASPPPYLLT
ncbi:hypothetical protein EON82_07450 [bacterium]|nr:MAG: hypothetical protein EON82_07450 [bacterium]